MQRALAVHLTEESELPEDKKDAAFSRNVRLAATIARLRLALAKAGEETKPQDGDQTEGGGGGNAPPAAELVIYKLPDNGR